MALAYATVANGGISYYPRLVDRVLNQDGSPVRDADGQIAVPSTPKVHADFRNELTPEQIEIVRHGFWEVVNEDGGTGSIARMEDVQVAGKTGTAQAMLNGKKDTIAWFCCFAPYDHPRYTIVVMVQGGEHGGSVAAPIATRILERTLAMEKANSNRNSPGSPGPQTESFCDDQGDQIQGCMPGAGDGDGRMPAAALRR
jgi:penicillin-binding protein 2